jgi:hypothetical protein
MPYQRGIITLLKKIKMAAGQEDVRLCCSLLSTHSVSCGEGGRAFYPTFSFMSHSCVYNARHVIASDYTMRVYAQKRIQQGDPTIHMDREHFLNNNYWPFQLYLSCKQ